MTTIFVAEFRHGKPALAQVTIIKETPKTYQVDGRAATTLMGYIYISNQVHKTNHHVFPTLREALAWLVSKADKYSNQCLDKYQGACDTQGELEDMLWVERQKGHTQ